MELILFAKRRADSAIKYSRQALDQKVSPAMFLPEEHITS